MSNIEPLRAPLDHEVCGTCRWWIPATPMPAPSLTGECVDPRKARWTASLDPSSQSMKRIDFDPNDAITMADDGCQCWEES